MKNILNKTLLYSFLTIFALITIFPFVWMILTSLKTLGEVQAVPPKVFPANLQFENYERALDVAPFGNYFINSIFVALLSTVIVVTLCSLAAFAFSKYTFRGKELVITLLFATMMVPGEMLMVTNFKTVVNLGLIDTRVAMFVPYMVSVFYIILIKQFFDQVPNELYLSSKVDGDSDFRYFRKILLPIARPILVTVALLNIIGSWNAFLWPLLVTNSPEIRTLPIGLSYFTSEAGSETQLLMAATAIIILPLLIVFLFTRKYIVSGLTNGAVKG